MKPKLALVPGTSLLHLAGLGTGDVVNISLKLVTAKQHCGLKSRCLMYRMAFSVKLPLQKAQQLSTTVNSVGAEVCGPLSLGVWIADSQ